MIKGASQSLDKRRTGVSHGSGTQRMRSASKSTPNCKYIHCVFGVLAQDNNILGVAEEGDLAQGSYGLDKGR